MESKALIVDLRKKEEKKKVIVPKVKSIRKETDKWRFDDKFLELAVAAKADVLVSSDVHLLEMHPFRGVQILQLADFKRQILEQGQA